MNKQRRYFLKRSLILSAVGICYIEAPELYAAWSAEDFAETHFEQTIKQISKGKPIIETGKIELIIPEIAENGAVVPVTVSSSLPDIQSISLIAEQNPVPLIITTQLTAELEPFVSARLKLAKSSFVIAIAETAKACYSVKKKVKVTIGGCGG